MRIIDVIGAITTFLFLMGADTQAESQSKYRMTIVDVGRIDGPGYFFLPCDLDLDQDCDQQDFDKFKPLLGRCWQEIKDASSDASAFDVNGDSCITCDDYYAMLERIQLTKHIDPIRKLPLPVVEQCPPKTK